MKYVHVLLTLSGFVVGVFADYKSAEETAKSYDSETRITTEPILAQTPESVESVYVVVESYGFVIGVFADYNMAMTAKSLAGSEARITNETILTQSCKNS